MGWDEVWIEGDCLEVINALNDKDPDCSRSFSAVISACISFTSYFSSFRASFIRRVGNVLAHSLAHFVLNDVDLLDGCILPAGLAF